MIKGLYFKVYTLTMNIGLLKNIPLLGIILALSAASFFALSLVTARLSYDYGTNVQTIMLVRFSCIIVVMLVWNKIKKTPLLLPKPTLIKCSVLGILYFIGIGSYLASVSFMPVGLAVLILYTFPILVILLTALVEKRKPGLLQFIALIIAFIGLFIALDINTTNTKTIGILLAISASIGVTINMVGSARVLKQVPFTLFSLYQASMVTALSSLVVVFTGGLALPNSSTGWLVFMTMLASFIIAYLSVYAGLKFIGAVRTSTIMNLEPILTTLFAIALLGEIMTTDKLIGGLIVISAILLAQWPQIRPLLLKNRSASI